MTPDTAVRSTADGDGVSTRVLRGRWPGLDGLLVGFGLWTLGYWAALMVGGGWAVALAVTAVLGAGVAWFRRRWPEVAGDPVRERSDAVATVAVLGFVVVWPLVGELGPAPIVVLALALLAARFGVPLVGGTLGLAEVRLGVLVGLIALTGVLWSVGIGAVIAALCLVGIVAVVAPKHFDRFGGDLPVVGADVGSRWWAVGALAGLGVLIAVWHVGVPFWNPDNAYYLNKAAHYADRPLSFPVEDYLLGVEGVTHAPLGNILSAFEPLIGLLAAVSPFDTLQVAEWLSAALVLALPFAVAAAARGLGQPRARLVGAVGAAAVLLMTGTQDAALFAQAGAGKILGAAVLVPLLLGALGRAIRRPTHWSVLRATLAAAAVVGMSPSLAQAAFVLTAAFGAAGVWAVWRQRGPARGPWSIAMVVPAAFVVVYALVSRLFQDTADQIVGGTRFDGPEAAWEWSVFGTGGSDHWLTTCLIVGSWVSLPLVMVRVRNRRAFGFLLLGLFGVIYNPLLFEPIMTDLLNLNFLAERWMWAIGLAVTMGLVVVGADRRATLGLLTIGAALLLAGVSGPVDDDYPYAALKDQTPRVWNAPASWPGEHLVTDETVAIADALLELTPEGGRFAASPRIEQVAAIRSTDRFPLAGRRINLQATARSASVPDELQARARLDLNAGFYPLCAPATIFDCVNEQPELDEDGWAALLEELDVAAVCVNDFTQPNLRAAVERTFVPGPQTTTCALFAAPPG